MRLLFFGSGEFAVPALRRLAQDHEVLQVVTQPDRPRGRGRRPRSTPVGEWARELDLGSFATADVNDPGVVQRLAGLGARLGVVLAFGQKIGAALRESLPGGCINAHASLLPRHRGAAPIQRSIAAGDPETGVTVFQLVERMDAGPILTTRRTGRKPEETAAELHDRLAGIAVDALVGALALYEEQERPPGVPQDEARATRAPKLRKEEGYVVFSGPAAELANRICAFWSWPGARCRFVPAATGRGEEVILARARAAEGAPVGLPPGEIDARRYVAAGRGMLEILEIQPAGGRLMTWQDFVHGRHVRAGDRLERFAPAGDHSLR